MKMSSMVKLVRKLKILTTEAGGLQRCSLGSLIKSGQLRGLSTVIETHSALDLSGSLFKGGLFCSVRMP